MTFIRAWPLVVREAPLAKWSLEEPLEYCGNKDRFTVPKGFMTDFASVPRMFWGVFPPYGGHTKAAVLHDWLYSAKPCTRKDADGIFLRTMRELGVSWWRRRTMYRAVRMFGSKAWRA